MNKRSLVLLILATVITTAPGCSIGDFFGQKPAATLTPTKTLVPTFTSTPTIVPGPTETPVPASTEMPTMLPETPIPTETATPTLGPPTNTPAPPPPAPTPTPRPPAPTNTPQPVVEFHRVAGPIKDPCFPGWCLPEIRGTVVDAQGNPLDNFNRVWLKLDSVTFGVEHCATGEEAQMLQPGQFKFGSPNGLKFGVFTLTVVRSPGGDPLSAPYEGKMNSLVKAGQQTGIVFQRTY